jgi:putative membrane protein
MLFSDADHRRVSAAIAAAEARTSGEIVVIVNSRPDSHAATALSAAALVALALPFSAVLFGWSPADLMPDWAGLSAREHERRSLEVLMLVQVLTFVVVLAMGRFTALGRVMTPIGLRQDRVHRAALAQFRARGLEGTAGRTGVLLYVDAPERVAEVIADTAIYEKVPPDTWADTIEALTAGFGAGRPADGIEAAVALAGDVLAAHFPLGEGEVRNELPDHLIEL